MYLLFWSKCISFNTYASLSLSLSLYIYIYIYIIWQVELPPTGSTCLNNVARSSVHSGPSDEDDLTIFDDSRTSSSEISTKLGTGDSSPTFSDYCDLSASTSNGATEPSSPHVSVRVYIYIYTYICMCVYIHSPPSNV